MSIPPHQLDRIRAYDPALAQGPLRVVADGLVNDVIIAGAARVFRFPKDASGRAALAREARLLDLVRQRVDLPVPAVERLGDDCATYPLLPGRALHRDHILRLDERGQERLAEQVGTFLRQLHGIPPADLAAHGIAASDSVTTSPDWSRFYAACQRELYPLLMSHQREWLDGLFAPVLDGTLDASYTPALIHGDLGPYHLLYDPAAGCLTGVLDFGTAGLGDPADDFANVINGLGEGFLRRAARYHPAIWPALDRARFLAACLELQWVLGGLRTQDPSWFAVHLGRARDAGPLDAQAAGPPAT